MEKILRGHIKLINGRFENVSIARSRAMSAIRGKGNWSTEGRFCQALVSNGVFGWVLHPKICGNPDIYFPLYKMAVFLDGCFWHGCPDCGHIPNTNSSYWSIKIARNIQRDVQKKRELESEGYDVLRYWEHELLGDVNACVSSMLNRIEDRIALLAYWNDCDLNG